MLYLGTSHARRCCSIRIDRMGLSSYAPQNGLGKLVLAEALYCWSTCTLLYCTSPIPTYSNPAFSPPLTNPIRLSQPLFPLHPPDHARFANDSGETVTANMTLSLPQRPRKPPNHAGS